jgi:NAD(P)-dependent dehydrogenase (short-subunit alcohol dehydrogenase family)
MNVKDNVAVVTGGASGIGLGLCIENLTKKQVFARTHDLEGAR